MRLMIWIGDEGPTDLDLKDGDVWQVQPDSWEPGALEAKKWLIVQTSEYGGDQTELVQPEYAIGASPRQPVQRHARKYCVKYWEKLIPEEIAAARDPEVSVPVMVGRFDLF